MIRILNRQTAVAATGVRIRATLIAAVLLTSISACKMTESKAPKHGDDASGGANNQQIGTGTGTGSGTSTDPAADVWFTNAIPAVAVAGKPYTISLQINRKKSQYVSIQIQKTENGQTSSIGSCASYADQTNSSTCQLSFTPSTATAPGSPLVISALVKFSSKSGDTKNLGQLLLDVQDGTASDFSLSLSAPAKNPADLSVQYQPGDSVQLTGSIARTGSFQGTISASYEYALDGKNYLAINGCYFQVAPGASLPVCKFTFPDPLNITDASKQIRFRISGLSGSLTHASNIVALAAGDTNLTVSLADFGVMKDRGETAEFQVSVSRKGSALSGTLTVIYQTALPPQSNSGGGVGSGAGNSSVKNPGDVAIAADTTLSWADGSQACTYKAGTSNPEVYLCKHPIGSATDQPYWAKTLNFRARAIVGARESVSETKALKVGSPLWVTSFAFSNPDINLPSQNMKQFLGRTLSATVIVKSSTANNDALKLTIRSQAGNTGEADTDCSAKAPVAQPKANSAPTDVTFNCTVTLPNSHEKPDESAASQLRHYFARVTQGSLISLATPELFKTLDSVGALPVTAIDPKKGPYIWISDPIPDNTNNPNTNVWFETADQSVRDYKFMVGSTSKVEFYYGTRNPSKSDQCENLKSLSAAQTVDSSKGLQLVSTGVSSVLKANSAARDVDRFCVVARAKKQAGSSQTGDQDANVRLRVVPTLYVYLDPRLPRENQSNKPIVPTNIRFLSDDVKNYSPAGMRTNFLVLAPGSEADETEGSNWLRSHFNDNWGTSSEKKFITAYVQRFEKDLNSKQYYESGTKSPYCEEGCTAKFGWAKESACQPGPWNSYTAVEIPNSMRLLISEYKLYSAPSKTGKLQMTVTVPDAAQAQAPGKKIRVAYRTCVSYSNSNGFRYAELRPNFNQMTCYNLRQSGCDWVDSKDPLEMTFDP